MSGLQRKCNPTPRQLDLDYFKALNDSYGHPHGDTVLREVARLLKADVEIDDCVARIGGEEFAVILKRSGQAGALEVAERIRKVIEKHTWAKRAITASLGLAMVSFRKEARQVLADADQALYRAKQSGKNQVCMSTLMIAE